MQRSSLRNTSKTGSVSGRDVPCFNDHERFLSKIKINQESGCWEWTGYLTVGYGNIKIGNENFLVHRVSYSIFKNKDISNLIIDHKCRNRKCVNPDHLRVADSFKNTTENSIGIASINLSKTHCLNGHEFTEENTRTRKDRVARNCKKCEQIRYLKNRNK